MRDKDHATTLPMKNMFGKTFRDEELQKINFASELGDSVWVLYGLVRALKPNVCTEIGAARGKFTCYIGMALRENGHGKLYSIDPHLETSWNDDDSVETYSLFQENIQRVGVGQFIEVVWDFSDKVGSTWKLPIDLLFIDGDHSYEGVKRDWELFSPHVTSFGLVVFHDTMWDLKPEPCYALADMGVPRFVEELRRHGYPLITLEKDCGVMLVQRTKAGVPLSKL